MTRRGRKRVALVLAAGTAMIPVVLGAYALRKAKKERLLNEKLEQGMAAYHAHDYETALRDLAYYVSRREDDAEATLALADTRRRLPIENEKHIFTAINLAQQASIDAADKRPALEMLLELYGLAGFLTERLEVAERMLTLDPSHGPARRARVECLASLGRTDQALAVAQQMAERFPDDLEMHRAVLALMELAGRPSEEILAYADALVTRAPTSVAAAVLKISAVARFRTREEALALAADAAALEPETVPVTAEMLRVLDALGMDAEAAALLDREVSSQRLGPGIAILAMERSWKAGRTADARAHLAQLPGDHDDDAAGWAALLEAQESAEPGPARAALQARSGPESNFWRDIVDGQAALTGGDLAAARERLRSAVAARPDNAVAEFLLGVAQERVGDWTSAAARWERVVARDPGFRVARIALVNILLRNGRTDEAREQAVRAVSARAGLAEVLAVARAFIGAAEMGREYPGDVQRAVTALESLQGRPSTDPIVLPLLARGYLALNRPAAAAPIVQAIVDGGVKPPVEDIIPLASALRRTAADRADALLAAAGRISPGNPDVTYATALRRAEAGDTAQARAILEHAVAEAAPEHKAAAQLQLASFLDRAGDPAAKDLLATLAADNPAAARFQLVLLDSQSAWDDQDLVAAAIGRLRALTGEGGDVWRFYEARRLLKFDRSPAQAAKVVQLLADLLRVDPNHPAGLTLMADAMILLDDRAKAIDYLARVVDASPGNAALYPSLIQLLQEVGQTDAAERRLREFARFGDSIPIALRRQRAQLMAVQGMLEEASREFEALAVDGSAGDRLNLARLCIRRGDHARARALLDELLKSPQPDAQVILTAAEFLAVTGDIDGGLTVLDRLPLSLTDAQRTAHRAAFLDRHGRSADAERLYVEATSGGGAETWASLARFYLGHGRHDAADEAAAKGLEANPGDADLVRIQGLIKLARGQSLPAGGLAEVAALVIGEGDERTRERFLEIVRQYEANPTDRAGFIGRLRRTTETSPTFYPAWYFLVSTLLEEGDRSSAAVAARVAARVMPSEPRAARLAVAALTASGEIREAYDFARLWQERSIGDTFEADSSAAYLLNRLDRPEDGLKALARWAERIEAGGDAMLDRRELLASLHARTGNADEAHRLLWDRASAGPDAAMAYLRVAADVSDHQQRREWLSRVEPLVRDRPASRLELAAAWRSWSTDARDPAGLEKAIALLGDDPSIYPEPGRAALILAASHEVRGETDQAARYYRAAMEHAPEDALVLNNFAYLLVTTGGSAEEALPLAQRAVELGSKMGLPLDFRASFMDTLGVVLLRLNRAPDAVRTFRDGLDLAPADSALLIGLAEAQVLNGQADAAAETLARVGPRTGEQLSPSLQKRLEGVRSQLAGSGGGG